MNLPTRQVKAHLDRSGRLRSPLLAILMYLFSFTSFAGNTVVVVPLAENQINAVVSGGEQVFPLTTAVQVVRSVTINASGKSVLLAEATVTALNVFGDGRRYTARCSLSRDSTELSAGGSVVSSGFGNVAMAIGMVQGFTIESSGPITINLVCNRNSGDLVYLYDSNLSVLSIPDD